MVVTTLVASVELIERFWAEAAVKPDEEWILRLDALLVGLVACLVVVILVDSIRRWVRIRMEKAR